MKCLEENRFDKYFLLFYNDGDMRQASSAGSEGASAYIVYRLGTDIRKSTGMG